MQQPPVSLSHTGFHVFDMEKMIGFYTRVFGFFVNDKADDGRMVFLSADPKDHHQLIMFKGRTADKSQTHFSHVAFRVRDMDALRALAKRLSLETEVTDARTCTHGNAWSIYFKDPEGNEAEAFIDTPWHVAQPFYKPIDNMFDKSDAELEQWTDKMLDEYPTKRPFDDWRKDMAKKLGME
jgi:catechol-2,3-dioxygenase